MSLIRPRRARPAPAPGTSAAFLRRAAFTAGALLAVRLGHVIPLPGLDPEVVARSLEPAPGVMGWLLPGRGAMVRLSILALGLTPLISAFVTVHLAAALARLLRRTGGDAGSAGGRIGRWIRILTAIFALLQGTAIAGALQNQTGLVPEPGPAFLALATLTLCAGALTLAWLAGRIGARGLGDGVLVILAADLVTALPAYAVTAIELVRQGAGAREVAAGPLLALGQAVLVIFVERARRRLTLRHEAGSTTVLALPVNHSGPVAPIFAYALLPFGFLALNAVAGSAAIGFGHPIHLAATALTLVIATFACAARLFDPDGATADLARSGATIPGLAPGPATAARLDAVAARLTVLAALYIAAVCVAPEVLTLLTGPTLVLPGYGLFLVVWTALDVLDARPARRGRA